jgi:UDP-glucose 4-epimerase
MRAYAQAEGIQVTVLRYCNVYGDHQKLDFVIPAFIHRVLHNRPLLLCNGGSQIRNYTYIDDAVEGTVAAVFRKGADYRLYNICSEFPLSVRRLAEKVVALHGSGLYRPADYEELDRRVEYEVECRMPSGEKAWEELGFRARTDIDRGLSRTYEYYKSRGM